jgi:hypothetical protein
MSKSTAKQQVYTINKVDHFDGTTTFELKRGSDVIKIYPAEALQHAIDALARIEQYQGIRKESEVYRFTQTPGDVKPETEES